MVIILFNSLIYILVILLTYYHFMNNYFIFFNIVLFSKYVIPTFIPSPTVDPGSNFLLLNNEFYNNTFLYGFEFYAFNTGTITIKVNLSLKISFTNFHFDIFVVC